MSGGSLLDLMVQDHVKEEHKAVERRVEEKRVATDLERERQDARQRDHDRAWQELERKAVEQAADRPPELAGFQEGMRFRMRNCGASIDGVWIVHRVDPGPAGDPSRVLYGRRADGGPGYLPLNERKALDALHNGLMVRLE